MELNLPKVLLLPWLSSTFSPKKPISWIPAGSVEFYSLKYCSQKGKEVSNVILVPSLLRRTAWIQNPAVSLSLGLSFKIYA